MLVPQQSQRQSIAQVCGPFLSADKNRIMNPIAAHKDELKKLLDNLSADTAVSGITFVASLDAYITRLETDRSDTSARVNPIRRQHKQTEN